MTGRPTGTVTFLFTDIEGSTRLARQHPESWDAAQKRHHELLQGAIEAHNGFVFQVIGDAFCAAFYKPGEALIAAYQAQQVIQTQAWEDTCIRVRMGIHTGEAEAQGTEYRGYLTLSLIQRLMSAGHGGQILLSGATEHLLRGQLPDKVSLRDLGKWNFRDVPEPLRVFQLAAPDLLSEFPPLRTIPSHPKNLPTQLTSFVGREKELADIQKLLSDTHILTLIGPGGTGKTRLSIQVASNLLDRFPDGLWLVELASILDPLLVPRVTAMTMGLRDEPQRPVIDMLCDYLREKKMLILLDNCEHLVEACARMAVRIVHAAPDVRILASSREALGIAGELTYRVPSLGLPDVDDLPPLETLSRYEAVRLFIDRATSAVPSFVVTNENAPAVAQICHRLDGIPLAIELAAAKVRVLGVDQIAKRLDDRFRLLTGGSRTALERHQTLRATIDWSYNLLSEPEQALFRRLSVFVDGWTLEAVEFVCQSGLVKSEDVLNILEQLINKSLVVMEEVQDQTRYSMLETLRQYANERLIESGESEAMRDRHLEYFLNLAEAAEPHLIRPEQLEWLAKLDEDYENIRLALDWALSKEAAEPSLRLCAALGWFWWVRGYWQEGTRWLNNALNKPSQKFKGEDICRVRALYHDAALAGELADLEHMKRSAVQSLALAQKVSDKRDIAIARLYTAWAVEGSNHYHRALSLLELSLRDFQETNDVYWESVTYRWLGLLRSIHERIDLDEQADHELRLARRAGEKKNLADVLVNRALQFFHFNRLDESRKYAGEARILFNQIGTSLDSSHGLFADMAWLRGDHDEARKILMEIRERSFALGDRNTIARIDSDLGILALEEGDLSRARTYLEGSLAIVSEGGNKDLTALLLAELGNLSYLEQNIQEFKKNFRESFLLARMLGLLRKRFILIFVLYSIYAQKPEQSVRILGALSRSERDITRPVHPLWKRYYDRAEAHTRKILGNEEFEAIFVEGQKLSLDQAIDLAEKVIEEI